MNDEDRKDPKDTLDLDENNSDDMDKNGDQFDSSETVKFSDDSLADFRKEQEEKDPFDVGQRDDSTRILDTQQVNQEKEKEQAIKEMWKQYQQETKEVDASSLREKPVEEARDDRTVIRTDIPPPPAPPESPQIPPPIEAPGPAPDQSRMKPQVPDYLSKHAKKQKRAKSSKPLLILVFVVAIAAAAYYFYNRSQNNQASIPAAGDPIQSNQTQSPATDTAAPKTVARPVLKLVALNVEDLIGIAPLNVAPKGPIFSDQMDPEAVAIAKALKSRVKIYNGEQSRKYRTTTTRTISGRFRGFTIKSELSFKDDKPVKDQLSVIAPSKGSLLIENDVLTSAKKMDYERFFRDLRRAGIQVIRKGDPNISGDFRVQLALTPLPNQTVPDAFVIAFNRAGAIQLGMRATQLDRVIPPRFNIVRKKILIDDQYVNIHKVFNENNKAYLLLSVTENRVKTVQIIESSYKTAQGIGIGSSLADLKINHLDIQMGKTKENVVFAVIKGINAKFMLSGADVDFDNQIFPNSLKITSVVLEN